MGARDVSRNGIHAVIRQFPLFIACFLIQVEENFSVFKNFHLFLSLFIIWHLYLKVYKIYGVKEEEEVKYNSNINDIWYTHEAYRA